MSWTSNAPLHFKIGSVVLWHVLTDRPVIQDLRTLGILKDSYARLTYANVHNEFEDMTSRSLPTTMELCRSSK